MNLATTTAAAILPGMIPEPVARNKNPRLRVAVLCDFAEENWPSMDLVGDMLAAMLERDHSDDITVTKLRPSFQRRFTRTQNSSGALLNADRLLNRMWNYQRWLGPKIENFDLFHIVDHSYSQLVHALPAERTIVSCHDLDTFRCLLEPDREPRSPLFRAMTRRVLSGFRKAARITCDSAVIRDELLAHKLFEPERLRVIPLGVHPTCSPEPDPIADAEAFDLLRTDGPTIDLLHVGSTIRRKRIDVLLKVLASLRAEFPNLRLLRVGGPFTHEQLQLIDELDLRSSIVVSPRVSREVLAAIYRHADLVMQPSDAEGFGLPLIEAMACGTPVLASDLPVLREVGGDAAAYAPVADINAWTQAVSELLNERLHQPQTWAARQQISISHSQHFTWPHYAAQAADLYRELLA
jgi:glycosyltransferase involved in cell wall biosynthesis